MTQTRPLPDAIRDAFLEKVKEESYLDSDHSFYEEYEDGKYIWTLDVQFHLSEEGYPSSMHSTILCFDNETDDDIECANYHDWELGNYIEDECRGYWYQMYREALDYDREMANLEYQFNLSRV